MSAAVALGLAATTAACGSNDGDGQSSDAPYYKGKTIEIIATTSPGGGSDTSARLLAEYLGKNIPGNPKIRVVNLTGAGGVRGGNEWEKDRDHDGTSLLVVSSTAVMPWLLGTDNVKYDLAKSKAVWTVPGSKVYYARADAGIDKLSDLRDPPKKLLMPGTTPVDYDVETKALLESLDIFDNVKTIYGYEGSKEAAESMITGETNFNAYGVGSLLRSYQPKLDDGTLKILWTSGIPDGKGGVNPDPNLPDVPTALDVYKELNNGQDPSGALWDAYTLLGDLHAWSILAHGDDPDEALAALDEGVAATLADPAYVKASQEVTPYDPVGGEDARAWSNALGNLNPDAVALLKKFTEEFAG